MEISVIIPAYNVDRDLINRCVDSLLEQSFKDFEIIIVNDGSQEKYFEILMDIQEKSSCIRVINQKNEGVSSARNKGTRYAKGTYICYVDADDMVVPGYLDEAYHIAKNNDADVVMGANSYIGLEKEIYDKRSETKLYSGNEIDSLKKYMVGSQMLYFTNSTFLGQGPWNRLIKNELAKKVNFNTNLKIGEDIVWNYELMKNSKRICVVNRCWYLYYINPSSASRRYRSDAINESKKSLIEIKKYLNLSNDEEYKAYCSRCLSDLKRIYYTYLSFPNNKSRDDVKILYTNPWSEAKSVKYFRLCSKKQKVVAMLYKLNLLFLYYRMKSFFKK